MILGFKGLKGIFHNIILIILEIHVTLINFIQTLKITSLFEHYQGSMVDQKSLLPAWKKHKLHSLPTPIVWDPGARQLAFIIPQFLLPTQLTQLKDVNPHFVYHNKCAPSLTRSLSHAPSFYRVGVWWFPATRAANMRKLCIFS